MANENLSNINLSLLPYNEEQLRNKIKTWVKEAIIEYHSEYSSKTPNDNASIQEISNETGIPVPTLYAYSSQGKLPCRRVGKRLIFSRKQIQNWIESHSKKTSEDIKEEVDKYLSAKRR